MDSVALNLPSNTPMSDTDLVAAVEQHRGAELGLGYYLARPPGDCEGAPVLVAVHGVSRNAREQVDAFSRIAARYGVVVVAPRFSRKRFRAYQRLGLDRGRSLSRPVEALFEVLDEVAAATGAATDRVLLFGYSGGGQFAHRLAMRHPERVRRLVMGAPGWATFPDATPFPLGIGDMPAMNPDEFLRVPALVLVGDRDRERDAALNRALAIDSRQGQHRIERGRRWVRAMRRAARLRGLPGDFRFDLLPGCAHSFEECVRVGRLVPRTMEFLLEPTASTDRRSPDWLVFSAGEEAPDGPNRG